MKRVDRQKLIVVLVSSSWSCGREWQVLAHCPATGSLFAAVMPRLQGRKHAIHNAACVRHLCAVGGPARTRQDLPVQQAHVLPQLVCA